MGGPTLRLSLAALTVLALITAEEARGQRSGAPDLAVREWRVAYPLTVLAPVRPTAFDTPVRILAKAGSGAVDQTIPAPRGPLEMRIDGRTPQSSGWVVLEWFGDPTDDPILSEHRAVGLDDGVERLRFAGVEGASTLRVIIGTEAAHGPVDIERVELYDVERQQLLRNPEFDLVGCPVEDAGRAPYGPLSIPTWRERYEGVSVLPSEGARRDHDPPLSVYSHLGGLAGLDQMIEAPSAPFAVRVRGRVPRGRAIIQLSWGRGALSDETWASTRDVQRRISLRGGEAVERFKPYRSGNGWMLLVAVIQLTPGAPLELSHVELLSNGRQLLRNPQLRPNNCPPRVGRPAAAATLAPSVRWPLTVLLAAVVLAAVGWIHRRLRGAPHAACEVRDDRLLKAAVIGVAALPLVSVGTVKIGLRIIPADWILGGVGIALAAMHLRTRRRALSTPGATAVAASILLAVVTTLALGFGLAFYTPENLAHLSTGPQLLDAIGTPEQRGFTDLLRLFQGVAALYAVVALARSPGMWVKFATVIVVGSIVLAVMAVYQVLGAALLPGLPQPPGAFVYPELMRAAGTFPEPTAYAGYMVFCAALSAVLIVRQRSRLAWAGFFAGMLGVVLSRSSAGIAGLAFLLLALLFVVRGRLAIGAAAALIVAVAGLLAFGDSPAVVEAVRKPFSLQGSVLDRRATWGGGLRMGAAYAPLGVGRGQFAYNFAPFVEPEEVSRGGRAQSALIEVWAESGPIGAVLLAILLIVGPLSLIERRRAADPSDRNTLRVCGVMSVTLGVVLTTYYTSNYVWIWVAIGLTATAHVLIDRPPPARDR